MSNETMTTSNKDSSELLAALTALRNGDFSARLSHEGAEETERAEIARVFNELMEMLAVYGSEVRRVSWETGTNGHFGAQAEVAGVRGEWQTTLTEFNGMVGNLTNQVRNFAQVTTAVANGSLSHKVTVNTDGEMEEWKKTVNVMVDQLSTLSDELNRVSREVVNEGRLSSQMQVRGTSGVWQKQIESVNVMAAKLQPPA